MSWLAAGYALWSALFSGEKKILLISNKGENAIAFLDKVKYIYDNLPEFLKPNVYKRNENVLWFGREMKDGSIMGLNSAITSVASSPDAGRSESLSLLIIDEAAFNMYAEDIWKAASPAISAGGQAIIISTANGIANWFYKFWKEAEKEDSAVKASFFGWRERPGRTEEWFAEIKKNLLPNQISQEFPDNVEEAFFQSNELSFYGDDFKHSVHVSKNRLVPQIGSVIIRSHDFGNTPACLFAQVNKSGQLCILHEMQAFKPGIGTFAQSVVKYSEENYKDYRFYDIADPAGWHKSETDAKSCAQILRDNGLRPIPGVNRKQIRFETIRRILRMRLDDDENKGILIISPNCEILVKGFLGGYCIKRDKQGNIPDIKDPDKNEYSHLQDCLQYIGTKIFNLSKPEEFYEPEQPRNVNPATGASTGW